MKKRIFSILFALVLAVSLMVVPAAVSANPGPILGFWEPGDPNALSTVEYSTAQSHSPEYSVYLKALKSESPTNDNKEIYVGSPTGVTTLDDLDGVSFWYYAPTGSDPVPPQIDVWLDLDGSYDLGPPPTGDEEWLLGQFPEVTTFDTWVEVPHSTITWLRGMGGTNYGTGSDGLTNAKAETVTTNVIYTGSPVYATLGDCPILAIGIQVGSSATRATNRAGDQEFYVDDLTINNVTYDLEPPAGAVDLSAVVPVPPEELIGIRVDQTSISFGSIAPGVASQPRTVIVTNIGNVAENFSTSLENISSPDVYTTGLAIDTSYSASTWGASNVAVGSTVDPSLVLTAPGGTAPGTYTATLVFWAEAAQ